MSLRRIIARELPAGVASGLVTGAIAFGAVLLLHADASPLLRALVAVSLVLNLTAACAWSALVPFLMQKARLVESSDARVADVIDALLAWSKIHRSDETNRNHD